MTPVGFGAWSCSSSFRPSMMALLGLLLGAGLCSAARAGPITYYDVDFEDGTLGGGTAIIGRHIETGEPTNGPVEVVASDELDGQALDFEVREGIKYRRELQDSPTHYVRFDYFADPDANLTQFLDAPGILRLDVSATGRHTVEVYYDLEAQVAHALLDGVVDDSLLSILAFQEVADTRSIRFLNQEAPPGSSAGDFEIDNFQWQGDVEIPSFPIPEPGTASLLGVGLAALGWRRRSPPLGRDRGGVSGR